MLNSTLYAIFAEREGFEPPVPCGTTVFKTVAIDHSAISPLDVWKRHFSKASAKVKSFFLLCKFFEGFIFRNHEGAIFEHTRWPYD